MAWGSIVLAVVGLGLALALGLIFHPPGQELELNGAARSWLCLGLVLPGLGMGGMALLGYFRQRVRGILLPVILALVVHGNLLSLTLPAVVQSASRMMGWGSSRQDIAEASAAQGPSLHFIPGWQGDSGKLHLMVQLTEADLDRAERKDAPAFQGMLEYLRGFQAAQSHYDAALQQLQRLPGMEASPVSPSQLQVQRAAVALFMESSAALRAKIQNSEPELSQILTRHGVSQETILAAVQGLRQTREQATLIWRIHEANDRMGKGMLGGLTVLESNWGSWRFDGEREQFKFQDPHAQAAFQKSLEQVEKAALDQAAVQQRLQSM